MLEIKLEDIIVDTQRYNEDNHLALIGSNAMQEYQRLKRVLPSYLTVTVAEEEDLFTRKAYQVNTDYCKVVEDEI